MKEGAQAASFIPKHVELILEINKTVIVASRWFLYYLTLQEPVGLDFDSGCNTEEDN